MSKKTLKNLFSRTIAILVLASFFTFENYAVGENDASTAIKEEKLSNQSEVLVGGAPFGIKFFTDGITVIGFSEVDTDENDKTPAYSAGLRENDIIMSINSVPVGKAEEFIKIIENCDGKTLAVDYKRNGKIFSAAIKPVKSNADGKYKTGMWIKDCASGIGTITYIVPETKGFAGLGHSICDSSNGEIFKLSGGYVTDVDITGVKPGSKGIPGELQGTFSPNKTGIVKENSEVGVFGIFSRLPKNILNSSIIKTADKSEIVSGPAKIRCTVDAGGICEYDINISEIDFTEESNKNFVIEVTDNDLISKSGGIVQGMSGSPIIQNGKLIGAVTHVFISDPTKGYGIYIENMTNKMPDIIS